MSLENSPLYRDFPEAKALTREDLEDLLRDPQYLQAFVHTLPRITQKLQNIESLELENEAAAERNTKLQQPLLDLRSETLAIFEEAKQLQAKWSSVEKDQNNMYQRYSASFLQLRLRHSVSQQDDYSESLANAFIEGTPSSDGSPPQQSIEDFLRDFKAARKTYHKRAMWSERWGRGEVLWRED